MFKKKEEKEMNILRDLYSTSEEEFTDMLLKAAKFSNTEQRRLEVKYLKMLKKGKLKDKKWPFYNSQNYYLKVYGVYG